MKKSIKWIDLILYIISAEVIGTSSSLLAGSFADFFKKYNEPPLLPPYEVFGIVWGILYAVMGVSAYLVHHSEADGFTKKGLLTLYRVQLILNFLWSIIFVRFELLWLAAIDIVLLTILVAVMVCGFIKAKPVAGYISIPYLLWLIFATYLNFAVIAVN